MSREVPSQQGTCTRQGEVKDNTRRKERVCPESMCVRGGAAGGRACRQRTRLQEQVSVGAHQGAVAQVEPLPTVPFTASQGIVIFQERQPDKDV